MVPSSDGTIRSTVTLNATEPGPVTVFAELAALTVLSEPFIVPSGRLKEGYVEQTDGGAVVACINVEGEAAALSVQAEGVAGEVRSPVTPGCDGQPELKSAVFTLANAARAVVHERGGALAPLELSAPQPARRIELLAPVSSPDVEGTLPDGGLPVLVRFRVRRSQGQAGVSWQATVTPQGSLGAVEMLGTTDASGEATLLLLAPVADGLMLRVRSGRAERVMFFQR